MRWYALVVPLLLPLTAAAQEPIAPAEPLSTDEPVLTLPVRTIDLTELVSLPTAVPAGTPKARDVWQWAPHVTVRYGWVRGGSIGSRFWYQAQDRTTDIADARAFGIDLAAGRWVLSGDLTAVPGRADVRGGELGGSITPLVLGPVRIGTGFRYSQGRDATELFSSGGTSIASSSQRQLAAATLDVGIGRYDRSHVRLGGSYGEARLTESLDLYVGGGVADSPLAQYRFSHSYFWSVGASGALWFRGIRASGAATCYRPIQRAPALPDQECAATAGVDALIPLWKRWGSGPGAFVRITRVRHSRPPGDQSLRFLNDTAVFGVTARIP